MVTQHRAATASRDDAARFCALYNSLYKRQVDAAYYRWMFFETPFPATLTFAMDGDTLLGCYGMQVLQAGPFTAAWARDIMIVPEWQGKGLFRPLAAAAVRSVEEHDPAVLLIMANQRSERAHVGGLGWSLVREFVDYEARGKPHGEPVELTPATDVTELTAIALASSLGLVPGDRTPAYLDWRFRRNPWYSYDLLRTRGGYLALKSFKDPVTGAVFGDIVDIAGMPYAGLIEAGRAHFRAKGITCTSMWLQTNTGLDEAGRAAGFTATSRRRYFCAKVLDRGAAHLVDGASWRITMADAEIY